MYNKEHNLLFIHIPKTAGSSICQYMFSIGNRDPFYEKELPAGFIDPPWSETYTHLPLSYHHRFLGQNVVDNALKYTIIRDPWDRLASVYFFAEEQWGLGVKIDQFLPTIYREIQLIEERGYSKNLGALSRGPTAPDDDDCMYHTTLLLRQTKFFHSSDDVHLLRLGSLQLDFDAFTERYDLPRYRIPYVNKTHARHMTTREFIKAATKNQLNTTVNFLLDYYEADRKLYKGN